MTDPYAEREQTKAKHFILRQYLEALAFKVLTFSDLTYVDGFSGPWETQTEDFSDSSFMIALQVLKDAQRRVFELHGHRPRIRCFFSETDSKAFAQLQAAVKSFHKPEEGFEVRTFHGKFEDAVAEIQDFIASSFSLIFIDPTGWTGYSFDKIKLLFNRARCEVLINFMYEFINRFAHSDDPETMASLEPILGGPGWRDRLDTALPRGLAVEKLFRSTLAATGGFGFVVSTKIDKTTAERPHFFITYGTESPEGLKAFRQTEYDALRAHVQSRANAQDRKRESRSGTADLFSGYQAVVQEATIDEIVEEQKKLASEELKKLLTQEGPLKFSDVVMRLLQGYMLRETNVKDICAELARTGHIENTWGTGNRKPTDAKTIKLKI